MKFSIIAALIAQGLSSVSCATVPPSPRCKDQDGQDVEWFIIYKLPRMQTYQQNSFTPEGGEFAYVDARTSEATLRYWPLSGFDLYEAQNPVAFTLAPLYENTTRKDILYFVYNDQSPPTYNGTRNGHSKGVVLFDDNVGVWLLHSVPRFADGLQSGQYVFPETARENGQMFMCVTFPTPQVDTIARLLRTEYANVYARQVPQAMKDKYPEVALLAKDSFVRALDQKLFIANLTSEGGLALRAYAKRATLDEDLYSGVLANDLKDDLAVQSWRNGAGGKLPPACNSSYTVVNIDAILLRFDVDNSVTFNTTEDHSKWAITIDRDESQETRGGEALCFGNAAVQALFRRSAIVNEVCPV
ncbi:hypothetical protein HPB50_008811 [Hyalomma asiaticum]|uniref:Uncharacterized protein n=1 Tax=Hyalomma asiaticum TaxID=266040 RepID=A0ACB7T595_HYAAI|nr:hypothetical protein HPB50_008811 [Hyalomma asiaticum]